VWRRSLDSVEISLIPSNKVHLIWPQAGPLIEKALAITPGRWGAGDIFMQSSEGHQGLWVVMKEDQVIAAFTTRIYEVPQARVCSVEWVGGEQMELWADQAVEIIEDYGRAAGCNKVEGHGRMGWSKLMKKHDWKFLAISHEKDIQ